MKVRASESSVPKRSKEDSKKTGSTATLARDRALGMNARICRRDFLNSALLASGSVLLSSVTPLQLLAQQPSWGGYTGEGDYAGANGNTLDAMLSGHAVRDGVFDSPAASVVDTGEVFDLVVVGGGFSGLAAGLFFNDQAPAKQTCLILENHAVFGGQARRNEFLVDGHRLMAPQGSNNFSTPAPGLMRDFYTRIGVDASAFEDHAHQEWGGADPAMPLSWSSYDHVGACPSVPNFGFWFGPKFGQQPGKWVVDPWNNLEQLPLSPQLRSDFAKYKKLCIERQQSPRHETEEELRRLDTVAAEAIGERYGLSQKFIRMYLAPRTATVHGLGPDQLTGYRYAEIFGDKSPRHLKSFPGGNTGFTRQIVKTLIPDAISGPRTLEAVCRNRLNFTTLDRPGNKVRIRLRSMAVRVEHEGDPEKSSWVRVMYTRDGKVYRLRARTVIMAGGGWITKHVVRDLPSSHRAAYDQFNYTATLVANVAVRNWRFLYKLGLCGGRWFEGFGFGTEVRTIAKFGADSPTIGPDSHTVLSLIVPYYYPGLPMPEQCSKGRAEMLSTPFREFERKIREQFTQMFAVSGFDARRDIAGIILNRWGHHFITLPLGLTWGENGKPAPREILRRAPFGRIAFANTDLAGHSGHNYATEEAHRAVGQVLPLLG